MESGKPKSKRGGARPGSGRPRKPKAEAAPHLERPRESKPRKERAPPPPPAVHELTKQAETKPKARMGRPSLYDPAMCEKVVALGAEGGTVVEMAVALNIAKATLYKWASDEKGKPEFVDALTQARELSEAYHARIFRAGCGLPNSLFNAAGYAKFMGIVFADWREITRTEATITHRHEDRIKFRSEAIAKRRASLTPEQQHDDGASSNAIH